MKKVIAVFAFLSMAMLVSCSGNGPEVAAKKFLEAISSAEFAEAKKYCDDSTAGMIGMMEGMVTPDKKAEIKKQDVKIEITSSEVKDSTATVKYIATSKDKRDEKQEKELKLVKVGDDWKVTMGKENPGSMPPPPAPMEPTPGQPSAETAPVLPPVDSIQ
jgi:hypothetical protein